MITIIRYHEITATNHNTLLQLQKLNTIAMKSFYNLTHNKCQEQLLQSQQLLL